MQIAWRGGERGDLEGEGRQDDICVNATKQEKKRGEAPLDLQTVSD